MVAIAESVIEALTPFALLSGVDDALCAEAPWESTGMSDVDRHAIVAMR
jgi:hypothetical protein